MTPEEKKARDAVRHLLKSAIGGQMWSPRGVQEASRKVMSKLLRGGPAPFESGYVLQRVREDLVARARGGDRHVHSVVEEVTLEFLKAGEILPEPLRSYHVDVSEGRGPKFKRAKDPAFLSWRNMGLALAVGRATEIIGNDSWACAIVRDVLNEMGLAAPSGGSIRKIWGNYKRSRQLITY